MEVCGYCDHYLGAFSQLVEHHVNTNEYSNGTKHDLWIDAFGMGYLDGSSYGSGCNGCMRIHEYIIYTNSLTHVERTKVAQHLMRKWLGKDVIWSVSETNAASVASVAAADGRSIDVAEGNSYAVMSLGGAGEIVKTGGGTLYLGNVTNARVTVKGGELLVRSFAPTNTFVPDGAWVHVDASDPASAEISESGGVKYTDGQLNPIYKALASQEVDLVMNMRLLDAMGFDCRALIRRIASLMAGNEGGESIELNPLTIYMTIHEQLQKLGISEQELMEMSEDSGINMTKFLADLYAYFAEQPAGSSDDSPTAPARRAARLINAFDSSATPAIRYEEQLRDWLGDHLK